MTMQSVSFSFIVDLETMKMTYRGVGFNDPPLLKRKDGKRELIDGGLPISRAVLRELLDFRARNISLERGSTLFVSTDGITEQSIIVGDERKMYGQRLKEVFFRESSSSCDEILKVIKEDFYSFNNHSQGDDDITL